MSSQRQTNSPSRADDPLVVHYSGRYTFFYAVRTLPFFLLFALMAALYLDDEGRRWFFSRYTSSYKPFSWFEFGFLLALLTAPLADFLLKVRRVRPGAVALAVSKAGIMGAVFHMSRHLTWSEIADVAVDGNFVVVRRQPRSLLQKILAGRGLCDISIPARHLDRDIEEILAEVSRFAPAALGRAGNS